MKNRKGFTLVEIMIVVAIIALLAAIAIPNLLRARLQANESASIAALKTVSTAMETWRAGQATADYTGASLANLAGANPPYIDAVLGAGTKSGYGFAIVLDAAVGGRIDGYYATAAPSVANVTGVRFFCVTEDGVVRAAAAAFANKAGCTGAAAIQ